MQHWTMTDEVCIINVRICVALQQKLYRIYAVTLPVDLRKLR